MREFQFECVHHQWIFVAIKASQLLDDQRQAASVAEAASQDVTTCQAPNKSMPAHTAHYVFSTLILDAIFYRESRQMKCAHRTKCVMRMRIVKYTKRKKRLRLQMINGKAIIYSFVTYACVRIKARFWEIWNMSNEWVCEPPTNEQNTARGRTSSQAAAKLAAAAAKKKKRRSSENRRRKKKWCEIYLKCCERHDVYNKRVK